MTDEEIGRLTITEVEAICERAKKALDGFREAQAAMLGMMPTQPRPPTQPTAKPGPPTVEMSAGEMVERERLLRQIRGDDLPPDIRAMEEQ